MRIPWRGLFTAVAVLSLLANAVVLGLFLRMGDLRDTLNGGGTGFSGLPRAVRSEVRRALADERAALAAPLARLGAARRGMIEAAAARPYDGAAVEARMAEVRAASAALQAQLQTIMLGAFARAAGR
jgi:uncharacterized membrane protein